MGATDGPAARSWPPEQRTRVKGARPNRAILADRRGFGCRAAPERRREPKRRPPPLGGGGGHRSGGVLLSHRVAPAVPSALEGLTSEFGMGSGVAPSAWAPANFKEGLGALTSECCESSNRRLTLVFNVYQLTCAPRRDKRKLLSHSTLLFRNPKQEEKCGQANRLISTG